MVRLVDRVAYINHDIDDAVRAGIIAEADLPVGRDRAARADRLAADRHPGPGHRRALARGRRHRPERGGGRGDAAAAQVHVRPRLPRPRGALRARARAADAARAVRPLPRASRRRCPRASPGPRTGPAGDRLHRGDDRPLLHRALPAARAAGGVAACERPASPPTRRAVKEAADIVEIVSAHTDLRRAGERFIGLCPFHDERTPSFSVDPRRSSTTASAARPGATCSASSRRRRGSASPMRSRRSAERYGVEVEREAEDPRAEAARRRRARLGELLERTAAFYASFLVGGAEGGRGARVPCRARA